MSNASQQEADRDEVKLAVRGLLRQANSISLTHLNNPMIQHQFRSEYLWLGKCLVDDYENGILSKNQVARYVRQERQSLIDQSKELAKYGIGFVAGVGQFLGGTGICLSSTVLSFAGASWCSTMGAAMMAHGGNNIYENSYNMTGNLAQNYKGEYTGTYGDGTGWLKKQYQKYVKRLGYSENEGNLIYGAVDIGTSVYGLWNKVKKVPNANVPNARQLILFRSFAQDFEKGWRTMSGTALGAEGLANGITIHDAIDPYLTRDK
ncbi:DUF4225 domain-containing protein [Photobacterium arenosum]|uniref:DUF4225 domain-containing protein n=1 Tax=Photobacterium arenosum TaxID=2774143 RepID=UPI00288C2D5C|nr:DUF4225 domain-containing protein [Photobacterium arenosum]